MAQIKRKNPPIRKRMTTWHAKPTTKSKAKAAISKAKNIAKATVSAVWRGMERTSAGLEKAASGYEKLKKSNTARVAGKIKKWGVETQKGRKKALNKLMKIA